MGKLAWFIQRQGYTTIGTPQLRAFLAYVTNSHRDSGGRWGNPKMTKPVS
jgi:hypothetical protein